MDKSKLTPMMRQYLEIKEQYEDCILFFRLGDFYEMFFDDALKASKAMQVTLTGKSCGLEERAPMCGVPYHAADSYIAKLIDKGFKVAICEQTEDPALAKGIVKREVIKIVTPGTLVEQTMLNEKENNYLAAICRDAAGIGLAYCDISTGELVVSDYKDLSCEDDVINELVKINVREAVLVDTLKGSELVKTIGQLTDAYVSFLSERYFDRKQALSAICRQFNVMSTAGIGLDDECLYISALGALLSYLLETQKQSLAQLTRVKVALRQDHMILDKAAIRNLELTETLFEKKINGSLFGVLDRTETAMGSRKLKKWIREPLNRSEDINLRLDAVELLTDNLLLRNNMRESLKAVYDLERLAGRIASGNANARDLLALKNSIAFLPEVKEELLQTESNLLQDLGARICNLRDVYERIELAITDEPPVTIKEGGLIKDGYSKDLDDIKASSSGSLSWIMGLEASERERTGISKLKVGFNKVFGYYIEVTKANADKVPEDYIRKQTLVNCERYVTPELKEMESIVLNAESRINGLEYELFIELREYLKGFTTDIQDTASAVAELDALASFAEVSFRYGYIKPVVDNSDIIDIKEGRHPVIEQTIDDGIFVSNDTFLNCSDQSMLLITGPNMAGKSTYMRQTALIVLMAQIGCFVPAESARIGVVDRIYTRIGASDNLAQGQSTFYVEMSELAYILNTATDRSLVILDEIGRGTSTYDGLAIAWAVVDYLLSENRHVRTLFASHYHELTVLEGQLPGFKNYNVSVSENDGDVVFLHRIVAGSASRSYGIHVARIAGVPQVLLDTAEEKLSRMEKLAGPDIAETYGRSGAGASEGSMSKSDDRSSTAKTADIDSTTNTKSKVDDSDGEQLSFVAFESHPAVDMIKNIDIMDLTPSKAIEIIEKLKKAVEEL